MSANTVLTKKIKMLSKQRGKTSEKKINTGNIGVELPAYPYARKDKSSPGKFSRLEAVFHRSKVGSIDLPRVIVRMNTSSNDELRNLMKGYDSETGKLEDWSSKDRSFIIAQKKSIIDKIHQEYARRIALLDGKKHLYLPTERVDLVKRCQEKRDEALAKVNKKFKEILSSLQEMKNRKKGVRKITVRERGDRSVYDASVPIGSDYDPLKEKKIVRNSGKAIYRGKKGTPKIVKISNRYS